MMIQVANNSCYFVFLNEWYTVNFMFDIVLQKFINLIAGIFSICNPHESLFEHYVEG